MKGVYILVLCLFVISAKGQEELGFNQTTQSWITNTTGRPALKDLKAVNLFVDRETNNGNLPFFDRLWIFGLGASNSTLESVVNPTSTKITLVNSPTFTAYQGFHGNGTSSYINTNFNLSTATNYSTNSASVGFYSLTNSASPNTADCGVYDGTNELFINCVTNINTFNIAVNSTTNSLTGISNTVSNGEFSAVRSNSTSASAYKNGTSIGSVTLSSSAAPNAVVYMCAYNNNGTAQNFYIRIYSMFYIGSSNISQSALYTDVSWLNSFLGW